MSGRKKFECPECEFIFASRESLRRHKKREHLGTYVPWENVRKIPTKRKIAKKWWKFKCDACDYKTLSEKLYVSHMRSNEHKAFAEVMLNYSQSQNESAAPKSSAPERQEVERPAGERGHGEAAQVVTKSDPAIRDEVSGITVKEFTCDECPYSTTWETEYMWHRESHHTKLKVDQAVSSEKKVKVELSGQGNSDFSPTNQANDEEPVHQDTHKLSFLENRGAEGSQVTVGYDGARKKYMCSKCERLLSSKDSLKWHMDTVHTDVKKFKCDYCKYAAKRLDHFRRHVEVIHDRELQGVAYVHTDVKKIKCNHCNYAAKRRDHLGRHVRKVHHKEPQGRGDLHPIITDVLAVQEESGPHIDDSFFVEGEHIECGNKNSEMQMGPSTTETRSEKLSSQISASKNFYCWECNYKTISKSTLKEHMSVHKVTNQLKCETPNREQDFGDLERELQGHPIPDTHHLYPGYGSTNLNTSPGNSDKMKDITEENNKKQKANSKKKLANNCLPNMTSAKALDLLNTTFTSQYCPYSTKWKKELNRHVGNKHINEQDITISSQTQPDKIVKNHDISMVPAVVQSTWKRRDNDKVDIFLCQQCNYRSVSKINFISHNRAIHGMIVDERSFEEKGIKAPSHWEHLEITVVPPLPQDQSETMDGVKQGSAGPLQMRGVQNDLRKEDLGKEHIARRVMSETESMKISTRGSGRHKGTELIKTDQSLPKCSTEPDVLDTRSSKTDTSKELNDYTCEYCKQGFFEKYKLLQHMLIHQRSESTAREACRGRNSELL